MSQVAAQTAVPAVPAAFRKVPLNPHSAKVAEQLQQMQQTQTPSEQPQEMSTPAPQQQMQQQMQQQIQQQIQQQVAPQPTAPQLATAQVPSQPLAIQTSPVSTHAPVHTYPQYDSRILATMQQLEAERQRVLEENAVQQQTIQNLLQAQQELDSYKQREALQKALAQEAFEGLETVDPEDAKKITNAVLNSLTPALTAQQQELARTRALMEENAQQMQQRMVQAQVHQTNQRILQKHPDFFQLQHTPEYLSFMQQRDGLSSQTRDQRAAQEFAAGNADYVIDILNQLKGSTPSSVQISTVAPVQTAAAVTPAPAVPQTPSMTLRELNSLYQMRQISQEEYKRLLPGVRAAEQA